MYNSSQLTVCCIQAMEDKPFSIDPEVTLNILRTNAVAPALLSQVVLPFLEKGTAKKILNISSTLGSVASADTFGPAVVSYSMSKAALNMLVSTRSPSVMERPSLASY